MTLAELKEEQRKSLEEFKRQMNGPERKTTEKKTRETLIKAGLLNQDGEIAEMYR